MKFFGLLFINLLILSCSHLSQKSNRFPSSSSGEIRCFPAMKALIKEAKQVKIPDYSDIIETSNSGSQNYFQQVISKRENKIPQSRFTINDYYQLNNIDEDFIRKILNSNDLKLHDEIHILLSSTEEELEIHLKRAPNELLHNILTLLASKDPDELYRIEWDLVFRRRPEGRAAQEKLDLVFLQDRLEAYLVTPRGGARTRTKKLNGYRIDLNGLDIQINQRKIPDLIKMSRLQGPQLEKFLSNISDEEIQVLSETARVFNTPKNRIYFFTLNSKNNQLSPNNNFSYIFNILQKELRKREEIASKNIKVTPLTTREDTFNFSTEFSDQDILLSVMLLQSRGNLALIPVPLQKVMMEIAGVNSLSDLREKAIQERIVRNIASKVEKEDINFVLGKNIQGTKKVLAQTSENNNYYPPSGTRNMHRGWGWRLLRDDDTIWEDPEYLQLTIRFSNAFGGGLSSLSHSEFDKLKSDFEELWFKFSAGYSPTSFTQTGSDANSLLYNLAIMKARKRLGDGVKDAEILYFDGIYGGVRGKIAGAGYHRMGKETAPDLSEFKIDNPYTYDFNPTNPDEITRVSEIEERSLRQIKEKFVAAEKSGKPIGGIIIEPISATTKGVNFYRPEYILKLQALCEELGIDIYADEILSGGGRTGKFWAHQHYKGFTPSAITFGKGLQIAGIATKGSTGRINSFVTQEVQVESLLKSYFTLKRIESGRLIENAEKVGQYFITKLQEVNGAVPSIDLDHPRGIGFMIWPGNSRTQATGAAERLFPYLDLTKDEVNQIIP